MAKLIDSSLWVDFTRAKSPPALKAVIQPWLLDPEACLCEPVAFEILRHATPAEQKQLEAHFATFPLVPTPATLWRDAAALGRRCRAKGTTPGSLDLLIAALALHHHAELITFDAVFSAVAKASPLRLQLLTRP
jgi:predicted nucleic acid-binding protein